jgi:succinoglycan biosynthesis protein ExoV
MHRYVWRGATSNFGDALNDLIWPLLLPGRFAEDADASDAPSSKPGASKLGAPKAGVPRSCACQTGACQSGACQPGAPETGARQNGARQTGAPETGALQTGALQTGAFQNAIPHTGAPHADAPFTGARLACAADADNLAPLFLGIGSVLDARHPPDRRKVVAGAGFGGYAAPASLDGTWEIYWVRGPRTAQQLGLPASFGLGDPASLLPLVHKAEPSGLSGPATGSPAGPIGFMPHFESLARGAWAAAASAAGVMLIDPRAPPGPIVSQIAGCRILLSEALHGVVVADALRLPWVALAPVVPVHRAKWLDWADSLDLTIRFHAMPASTPRERLEAIFAPKGRSLRTCLDLACALAQRLDRGAACLDRAVGALRQAAAAAPQLSPDRDLARAQGRMLDRLRTFRADQDGSAAWGGRAGRLG